MVPKAFVEAEWPTVAHLFPGTEIKLGKEDKDGMAELTIEGDTANSPQTVAYAMGVSPHVSMEAKPSRPAVGQGFVDHSRERKMTDMGLPPPEELPKEVSAGAEGEAVEAEEAEPPKPKKKKAPAKRTRKKKA